TPALASSGPSGSPTSDITVSMAMVPMTKVDTLRSSDPIVSARCRRRSSSPPNRRSAPVVRWSSARRTAVLTTPPMARCTSHRAIRASARMRSTSAGVPRSQVPNSDQVSNGILRIVAQRRCVAGRLAEQDHPQPPSRGTTVTSALPQSLTELAHGHGVATEFWDWQGNHRDVEENTIRVVLDALGVAAADEQQVTDSLAALREAKWRRVLPPVTVVRAGRAHRLEVHLPSGTEFTARVLLEEDGVLELARDKGAVNREIDGVKVSESVVLLPDTLPLGWHQVEVAIVPDDAATS